ncbi:hypothetical protein FGG08_002432 [Glutinoglossum americanum]|uniref:glutamate decarboxylase n=1 Tax=Glutinoglossum americanum TaxID=1670608 RepID=A0A9P8IBQ1_9PEZI|nr:hypothetical protein FGG08_002432 [Glutinoglossum americanum]
MVHLQGLPNDKLLRKESVVESLKIDNLVIDPAEDEFTASVYGSRFAAQDLPKVEMPEREMPKEVAYRMIKDDLSLDGNPMLKISVEEFVRLVIDSLRYFYQVEWDRTIADNRSPDNSIDYEEYPQSADIVSKPLATCDRHLCTETDSAIYSKIDASRWCVKSSPILSSGSGDSFKCQIGRLFGTQTVEGETAIGTSCVGSSEKWQNKRKAEGKPYDKPNIVMSAAVQGKPQPPARYFEVEEKFVYCTESRYVIDPEEAVDLVDENTIGICAILGTTYTGEYEDVQKINDLLVERGIDCPIHVDAASGGFVVPFVYPELVWDFRLEKVVSINVSGHKYGLVYPGVGWVVWRAPEYLPKELVFNINYLGADQASFTLNFSKGASQVIGQYYQMIRLGKRGYRSIMMNLTRTADYLAAALEKLGFIIMSKGGGKGLPVVAFRLDPEYGHHYDEVRTELPAQPYIS